MTLQLSSTVRMPSSNGAYQATAFHSGDILFLFLPDPDCHVFWPVAKYE
jgi:hypothetical protein